MTMSFLGRALIAKRNPNHLLPSINNFVKSKSISRFVLSSSSYSTSSSFLSRVSRPLSSLTTTVLTLFPSMSSLRLLSTSSSSSNEDDDVFDGCDYKHWLVVFDEFKDDPTRDEIIDRYIKTLAQVVGSEEEAKAKIYSVSTRHYFAFGCLIPQELTNKIRDLSGVLFVVPDTYMDNTTEYGGEPFINGQAVPYDPKYHEEWRRNNAIANAEHSR